MSVVAGKRKSGKGQKCPSCGAITFQQYGQVFGVAPAMHAGGTKKHLRVWQARKVNGAIYAKNIRCIGFMTE